MQLSRSLRSFTLRRLAWLTTLPAGLALLALALHTPASPVRALVNCETNSTAMDLNEQGVMELMNAARAQNGAGPLKVSAALNRAAAWKSADPSAKPPLSHTDSLGRNPVASPPNNRAMDCGYASWAAENIAYGFSSPASVMEAWMGSAGHRANIVNPSYVVAGVGLVNGAWTVNFGTFDDSGVAGEPTPTTIAPPTIPAAAPTATPTAVPLPTATPTVVPSANVPLSAGFNLITYASTARSVPSLFASLGEALEGVYRWDQVTESWAVYTPGVPSYASTLLTVRNGDVLFIELSRPANWSY